MSRTLTAGVRAMRAGRLDAILVALVATLVYASLGQETLYKTDGRHLLRFVLSGALDHPVHPLYLPMLDAAVSIGAWFGWSPHTSGVQLSALGMGIGVGCAFAATRILAATRMQAFGAAALFATTPAVLFFATVVELHGPFVAFAGVTFVAAARVAAAPRLPNAVVLGACSGLAVGAHSTGHLLPLWWVPFVFVEARRQRPLSPILLSAAAVHGAVAWSLPDLLRVFGRSSDASAARTLADSAAQHLAAWPDVFTTAWHEWLVPFAPLAWVVVAVRGPLVTSVVACVPAIVASIVVAFLMLGDDRERGAYLLPLALPLAAIVARAPLVVPGLAVVTALAGATFGITAIRAHDRPEPARAFAAGYRTLAQDRETLLVIGSLSDVDATLLQLPDVRPKDLFAEAGLAPELLPAALPLFLDWLVERATPPRLVLMTEGAVEYLAAPRYTKDKRAGPLLLEALRERFTFEPARAAGFAGYALVARPR